MAYSNHSIPSPISTTLYHGVDMRVRTCGKICPIHSDVRLGFCVPSDHPNPGKRKSSNNDVHVSCLLTVQNQCSVKWNSSFTLVQGSSGPSLSCTSSPVTHFVLQSMATCRGRAGKRRRCWSKSGCGYR